jgi:hypothetical protein
MSFILDALRKIDRERPAEGSSPSAFTGAPAFSPDQVRRRREITVMASIAAASAVLTAVAFMLVSRNGEDAANASGASTVARAPAARENALEAAPVARELPPATRELPPRTPEEAAETIRAAAVGETVPEIRVRGSSASVEAPPEPESEEPPATSEATAAEGIEEPEVEEELSPSFPPLVLQGTSFINGIAVAVISDRRVFEGDTIEGAVVIRIEERSVELEFEGHRFTISL